MPAVNYNKIKYFLYYFQIINLFVLLIDTFIFFYFKK